MDNSYKNYFIHSDHLFEIKFNIDINSFISFEPIEIFSMSKFDSSKIIIVGSIAKNDDFIIDI